MSKSRVAERSAAYALQTAVEPAFDASFDLLATAPQGVAKLREFILSLAVRGKLVPQVATDEPAEKLLRSVRKAMQASIDQGQIRRERTSLPINIDDIPYAVPESWAWVRLATVLPFQIGRTPPSKDSRYWNDSGTRWVSISDMPHRGRVSETQRHVSELAKSLFGYEPLPAGTLLMSFKLTIGKVAILDQPAFHNEAIVSFQPPNGISTGFLQVALPDVARHGASKDALMGSTLNSESLANLLLPIPPLAEQARIVARVEELMQVWDALEAHRRLLDEQLARLVATLFDTLAASKSAEALAESWQRIATHFDLLLDRPEAVDALEQTLLQLAVRGLLVAQDLTDEPARKLLTRIRAGKDRLIAEGEIKRDKPISPVPVDEQPFEVRPGWEWAPFGTLVNVSSGITLGRKATPTKPVTLPYLRVANVQRWHLDLDHLKTVTVAESELPRFLLRPGDLLLTEGGDWDKVGRTCIWKGDIEQCLHQNHVFKARGVLPEWLPSWAELYLNSADARSFFASASKQTTNLASINSTQLKGCPFPLPPLAEQHRIVARVEQLRRLCAELRERLQQARTTQSRLADALVSAAAQSPSC
jgi:type I restriction enzyme S subunit